MAYVSPNEFKQKIRDIDLAQGRDPRFPEEDTLLNALMDRRQEDINAGTAVVPGNLADVLQRRKREQEMQMRRLEDVSAVRG